MPTVPKYEGLNVTNNVSPNVQFNTNAPAEAFGGGRAAQQFEAARELGNVGFQIANKARQDADDVAFAEYASQIKRQRIDLELNKESGLLNRKGKDAFNLQQEADENWKKRTEELIAQAPNERVKERLSRVALAEGDSLFQAVQGHVSRELRAHDEAVSKALTETAVNDAILNKDNPEAYQNNLAIAQDSIQKYAARNGMDAVQTERLLSGTLSRAHAMAITQYLDAGQDRVAKAHFEKYGDQIKDAEVRGQIEKNLEAGTHLGEVTRVSDEITTKTNDMRAAMLMLQDITDPKIRKDAQAMVFQTFELKRRADRDRSEQLLDNHMTKLEQARGLYDLPVSMRTAMNSKEIQAFEARKEQILSGKGVPPNGEDYYKLRLMASDPTKRDEFREMNLRVFTDKMQPSEMQKLIEYQANIRSGSSKSDKELGAFMTRTDIAHKVMRANGINPNAKDGTSDSKFVAKFTMMLEDQSIRFAEENKREPTQDEFRRMADGLFIERVTQKGTFWDTKKKTIDLFKKYRDIPSEERTKIEEALRINKMPVTPQAVESRYFKKQIRDSSEDAN